MVSPCSSALEKTRWVVDLLGIGALLERWPGTLSGGEQQRAAIARALINDPEVIIAGAALAVVHDYTDDESFKDNLPTSILADHQAEVGKVEDWAKLHLSMLERSIKTVNNITYVISRHVVYKQGHYFESQFLIGKI